MKQKSWSSLQKFSVCKTFKGQKAICILCIILFVYLYRQLPSTFNITDHLGISTVCIKLAFNKAQFVYNLRAREEA